MAAWNANAPGVLGLEWFPTVPKTHPIAQSQPSLAFRMPSLAAETIAMARLGVASNPATTSRIFTIMDIVPAGSEQPSALQVAEYAPNADATIGSWTTDGGGTVNLFARIDDAVTYPPTGTDYIRQLVAGNSAYRCEVATAGFPATARVLRVSIRIVIGMVSLPGTAFVEIGLFHAPSSTVYNTSSPIFFTNGLSPNYVLTIDCGEINPVTLLPWTPADIQSFDTGTWHMRVASSGTTSNGPQVAAMALRVSYVDPENRVAAATYRRPSGAIASVINSDALVTLPAGTSTWAKANGVTYTYIPRWARDRLVGGTAPVANDLAWRAAQQDLGPAGSPAGLHLPPAGFVSSILPTDEHGLPTQPFASEQYMAPRLVLLTSLAANSQDSQPYVNDGSTTVIRSLVSGSPVGQRITPAATRTYQGFRTVVKPPTSGGGTLTVRIVRVSDGVQFGGDYTISADDVRALPEIVGSGGFRYLQGVLATGGTLVSGTQYQAQLMASSGTWAALVPSGVGAGSVTLGGTTDFARTGGTSLTEQDMAIVLLEQPSAPTALTAEVVPLPVGDTLTGCGVTEVDQVNLDWASTALAGSFDRYEIQRDEDDERGFLPVWEITSAESMSVWTDYEAPLDRPVRYRVRVVSTSTAFSPWVESGWVTCSSRGAEVVFTSNHSPDLQVVYQRDPGVNFGFLDHTADELVPIYGADYQVAFFEPEDRGMSMALTVIANFGRQPVDNLGRPVALQAVFQPLRDITRSTAIPYVCVRLAQGARVFATVELSAGNNAEPGWRYKLSAAVTPVTGDPVVGTS